MMEVFKVAAIFLTFCLASRGDDDPAYKDCVSNCVRSRLCDEPESGAGLPFYLRLTGWNCQSNCRYDCMWHLVEVYREEGYPLFQYHGKWPFTRVLGIQELASVIFSMANGYAHWVGWAGFFKALGPNGLNKLYLTPFYRLYFASSILAWSAATLFHCRDVAWTEHADYLTAIGSIFVGLYVAVLRHGRIIERGRQLLVAIPFLGLLLYHLNYMLRVKFDYGWNMKLLAVLFGIFGATWLGWGLFNFKTSPAARWACLWVGLAACASSLELWDFEPWVDLVDSHALWHLATVPLSYLIWKVYAMDAVQLLETKSKHAYL